MVGAETSLRDGSCSRLLPCIDRMLVDPSIKTCAPPFRIDYGSIISCHQYKLLRLLAVPVLLYVFRASYYVVPGR